MSEPDDAARARARGQDVRPRRARPRQRAERRQPQHGHRDDRRDVPMGGLPGPGPTGARTRGRPGRARPADDHAGGGRRPRRPRRPRLDDRPVQQQAGDVAVPRLRVPPVRRPDQHLHAVPGPPLREPRPGPDLRHPVHVGVELRAADELADDGARGVGGRPRRRAQLPSCGSSSPPCSGPRSSAARRTSSRRSTARAWASRRACSRRASTR